MTRHDKPVARLVPRKPRNPASIRNAVAELRKLRARIAKQNKGKPPITLAEIKSWVQEGRK
jgi:antitoxin (DNA-binding transcriptional repressor) of toxin-antitoxin stability system